MDAIIIQELRNILAEIRVSNSLLAGLRADHKMQIATLVNQRVDSAVYGPCGMGVELQDSDAVKELLRVVKLKQGEVI